MTSVPFFCPVLTGQSCEGKNMIILYYGNSHIMFYGTEINVFQYFVALNAHDLALKRSLNRVQARGLCLGAISGWQRDERKRVLLHPK